jgi:hypothetical protein
MILVGLIPVAALSQQTVDFDQYFIDKTMRIDYYHIGDAKHEFITLDQIYHYGIWAGSPKHLLDQFDQGRYYVKVYDAGSGKMIFSKGFDSYFGEYKSSGPALKGIKKTFHESALIPCPKDKIVFMLERRDKYNDLHVFFSDTLDPEATEIIRHEFSDPGILITRPHVSGDPHKKVDVVILADGYSSEESNKFKQDVKKVVEVFFEQEPYKSRSSDFNIYAVLKSSIDSGIDEPRARIYKQTSLSTTFNSMGSERYVLTEDNKAMRDIAAHVPYDAIYIMVNHHRYGGGGIYNLFCTFTLDPQWMKYLFTHEFGHSFTGLADEYYSSPIAYADFYPKGVEPREPNITALLDPANIKWKSLLSEGVLIPTPWFKSEYDSINFSWQKLRVQLNLRTETLKRERASEKIIRQAEQTYARENKAASDKMDAVIQRDPNRNKVGAFEGAGYSATGLYRSQADCIMFSTGMKPFCAACLRSINQMIDHYVE